MKTTGGKIKYTVRLKLSAVSAIIIAALLVLMNTYPVLALRDLVFDSKQSSMLSQAMVVSSSMSSFEAMTAEGAERVMNLLSLMPLSRVLITDDGAKIVYDSSSIDPSVGRYALLTEINLALQGKSVFHSTYEDGVFKSLSALPIVSGGRTIGAVYLYEYDESQGQLISSTRNNLGNLSVAIVAFSALLIGIFTTNLARRLRKLIEAMHIVGDGELSYRVETKSSDEIGELGEEFNKLAGRLEQNEELRRRFVSDASHELKTPLASIRLLSDSIVQSGNMDPEMMREFVGDIGNESERLQRLTEKLLSLTRLESGVSRDAGPIDLKETAEQTLHLLSPLARQKNISLEYSLSDGCIIRASADDMYQVIFNLVENGIKYNVDGGSVRLLLFSGGGKVELIVDDTGIGIPEESMEDIFSRFYRVDKARSRETGGSGLGLSIVHDAVVANGGEITVQRREPTGTRFRVVFPLYSGEGVPE